MDELKKLEEDLALAIEDLEETLKKVTFDLNKVPKIWKRGFDVTRKKKPKWMEMYRVVERQKMEVTKKGFFTTQKTEVTKYVVINVKNQLEAGEYNDYAYAASRARYFYKRDMRQAEKILLGS